MVDHSESNGSWLTDQSAHSRFFGVHIRSELGLWIGEREIFSDELMVSAACWHYRFHEDWPGFVVACGSGTDSVSDFF